MIWLKVNEETYYDVYECSHCHAKIMIDEGGLIPCYCKSCEQNEESEVDTE